MASARDTDWTHIHVAGDRDAAAPYVSYARKLLGYVKQDAGYNGLMTHGIERQLSDGAVIRAEIVGGIPRITINPPGGGSDVVEADWFEGVVLLYSHLDHPATAIEVIDPNRYGTNAIPLYMGDDTAHYNRAVAPKGVWYKLQPELMVYYAEHAGSSEKHRKARTRAEEKVRNGFSTLGNVEDVFHENTDGFCVTYRGGPRGKYFVNPTLITDQNGSKTVYFRGRAVFDVEAISSDDWRVFGASIKKSTLYAVVSIPTQIQPYSFPEDRVVYDHDGNRPDVILPTEEKRGEVFIAPVYAHGPAPVKVLKINLTLKKDEVTNQLYYKYESYEVLYEGILHNADGPWVFDDEVTHAVCIARPDECRLSWNSSLRSSTPSMDNTITPSTTHLRHFFDIQNQSMSTSDAGDVIAEDSGKTLRLERTGAVSWDYVWDGGRVAAYHSAIEGTRVLDFEQRILIDADVKRARFVFAKQRFTNAGEPEEILGAHQTIEVFCDGEVYTPTVTRYDAYYDAATPLPNPHGVQGAPMHVIEIHKRLASIGNISAYARANMIVAGVEHETWSTQVVGFPLIHDAVYAEASRSAVSYFGGAAVCVKDLNVSANARWKFFLRVPDAPYYGALRLLRHGSRPTGGSTRSGAAVSTDKMYLVAFKVVSYWTAGNPWVDSFVFSKGLDIDGRQVVDYKSIPHSAFIWGPPPPQQKRRYIKGVDK